MRIRIDLNQFKYRLLLPNYFVDVNYVFDVVLCIARNLIDNDTHDAVKDSVYNMSDDKRDNGDGGDEKREVASVQDDMWLLLHHPRLTREILHDPRLEPFGFGDVDQPRPPV